MLRFPGNPPCNFPTDNLSLGSMIWGKKKNNHKQTKQKKPWWNRCSIYIVFWIYSKELHWPFTDSSWEMPDHPYYVTAPSTPHALQKGGCWGLASGTNSPAASWNVCTARNDRTALGFKGILSDFPRPVFGHIPTVWAAALPVILTREMAERSNQMSHLGTKKTFIIISRCKYGGLERRGEPEAFFWKSRIFIGKPLPHSKLHLTQYIDLGWIDESLSTRISFIYISVGIRQLSHFGIQLCTLCMCASQCPSTAKF